MPPDDGPSDLVEQADAFDEKVYEKTQDTAEGANGLVGALVRGLSRQKLVSRWLVVSICLDVMLTLGMAYYVIQSSEQAGQLDRNTAASALNVVQQHNTCLSGNEFRTNERMLWDQILSLPPQPGLTPLQLKARLTSNRQIRGYLDTAFKLRNCTVVPVKLPQ